ncbi:MAG: hypothetical protein E6K72_09600, partial [Candidatus Eisenbacteria bacterium]
MAAVGKKGAGSKRRGRVERAPAKRRLEALATAPARSAGRAETPLPSAPMRSQATDARDALALLRGYRALNERLVVGLMTGTSADAVDAALVRMRGLGPETRHTLVAYRETPLEAPLRREILEVAAAATLSPERLMRLDAALGER